MWCRLRREPMAWISSCRSGLLPSRRRPLMSATSEAPSRHAGNAPMPWAAKTDSSALSSNSPTTRGTMPRASNQRSSRWRSAECVVGNSKGNAESTAGKAAACTPSTSAAGPYQSTGDCTRRSLLKRNEDDGGGDWQARTRSGWCMASSPRSCPTSPSWHTRRSAGVSSTGCSSACAASLDRPSDSPTTRRTTGALAAGRTSCGMSWPSSKIYSARDSAARPGSVSATPRPAGSSSSCPSTFSSART